MSAIVISCPGCGYSREVAAEQLPPGLTRATCPRCRHSFPLNGGPAATSPLQSAVVTPIAAPADRPTPTAAPHLTDMPLEQGGRRAKSLLVFFLLLVIVLVGVRLWADGKKRSVPFPNFITAASPGVALSWGEDVYRLDHAGRVLGKQSLPPGTELTQLQFVGDELWLADHKTKSVCRLGKNGLERVISGADRFRGAFKFAVDLQSRDVFVADASNHTIHHYRLDGSYLGSFGREGKKTGELKFPNSILFDRDGNLLVVNTNCFRIDIFSRRGEFLRTFAHVAADGDYKYPTLLTPVGDKVAFFQTIDLHRARIMLYGDDGLPAGSLEPPAQLYESGDLAAWDGSVLVTDNGKRQIYRFAAVEQEFEGPFSRELAALGAEANAREARYGKIADTALLALLLACLPVFYLLYRTRRQEQQRIEATDTGFLIPPGAILGVPTDRRKLAAASALLVTGMLAAVVGAARLKGSPAFFPGLMLANALFMLFYLRFLMESNYANPARRAQVEKLARAASGRLASILAPGEVVELCTVVQRSALLKQPSLLLLTTARLLLFDFAALRPTACCMFGYGDITALQLEPVKLGISPLNRLLRTEMFRLRLTLLDSAEVTNLGLVGMGEQILAQVQSVLEVRRGVALPLGYAVLCITCGSPLDQDGCPVCRQGRKADWKPLLLSLLYPGFGQFYNRELLKGAVFSIVCTLSGLGLVIPVMTIIDRSAEITPGHLPLITLQLLMLVVLYGLAIVDADMVGRKGRRLFSKEIFSRKR